MSERMGNLVVFNQIPLRDEVGPHAGFQGELVLAHIEGWIESELSLNTQETR